MKYLSPDIKSALPLVCCTLLLAAGLFPVQASAANGVCNIASGGNSFNTDFGNVSAQRNLPVGSLLAVKDFASGQLLANCTGTDYDASISIMPTYSSGSPTTINGDTVFPTIIPGVGLAARIDDKPINRTMSFTQSNANALNPKITIKLYKTGNIISDRLTPGQVLEYKLATGTGLTQAASYNITSGTVTQSACEITGATAIPVDMGRLDSGDLHGKGSSASPVSINIPLSCDAGTKVNISFAATSSQGDGIIDLENSGAKGVGIKLMYNNIPVKFSEAIFIAQSQADGAFNIPLTAAFTQTSDEIEVGEANAVANFTITYD